ncbi:MAG: hypothetical protein COV29_01750 [Candidatus Yanofskybacteria bacterium CG10_big_fil_rev_8_21_14_0_10_36_16]|uniref:DUF4342 domain-containing protein n=1 Tax=Candidatus Yanofskybacteria bacterium CG10_big_fil_rev_8_21_14_0_10_36_16 TaxID=1975096 RepID=A0A2J0Q7I7_9BACT|nr:MAG: hypothetical protein COV29_01750 [Candidatus Yanofskybacteria bacterium CG10_big_fil_rev_8_21_14_0_10_36_16]
MEEKIIKEEIKVASESIVKKVKELVHEGNVRKIIIKKESGESLLEIPLTLAVVGVVLAPVLAAVGALAALATDYILVIERKAE